MEPIETHKVRSRTDKKKHHLVHVFEDGDVKCTCRGFEFRRKCIHSDTVNRKLKRFEEIHEGHSDEDTCGTCFECVKCREVTGYTHGGCQDCV